MNIARTLCALLSAALIVGCTPAASENSQALRLSVGVMPAVDSAPIFLAEAEGYFRELGLDATITVYTNAMNRQSALQSGGLDGAMTDVIALVNNVENGFAIKVTTGTDGMFPVLVRPGFSDAASVKIGMMEVSVTNFLADRALSGTYELEKVYVNEIPARLELLGQGSLDMAVIPEPVASQGELSGLTKKLLDNPDPYSPDVLVFTENAIRDKEEAVRLFHQAYNKAVQEINRDDEKARALLIEKLNLDPNLRDLIILPEYHEARVPDEAYFQGVLEWNARVLGKTLGVSYGELVDVRFCG